MNAEHAATYFIQYAASHADEATDLLTEIFANVWIARDLETLLDHTGAEKRIERAVTLSMRPIKWMDGQARYSQCRKFQHDAETRGDKELARDYKLEADQLERTLGPAEELTA